jgi:hypothetical protein
MGLEIGTLCRNGFEHHAAMNASQCGSVLAEAAENCLGWSVYRHELMEAQLF